MGTGGGGGTGPFERALDGTGKKGKVLVIGTLERSYPCGTLSPLPRLSSAVLTSTRSQRCQKGRGASRVGAAPFGPEGGARCEVRWAAGGD
jgi:hypothetical protein